MNVARISSWQITPVLYNVVGLTIGQSLRSSTMLVYCQYSMSTYVVGEIFPVIIKSFSKQCVECPSVYLNKIETCVI